MSNQKFDNEKRISIWEAEAQSGLQYFNGTVMIDGVDYVISLFNNESENPKAPVLTGRIEVKKVK